MTLVDEAPHLVRGCPAFTASVVPALIEECGSVNMDMAWATQTPKDDPDEENAQIAEVVLDTMSQGLGGEYMMSAAGHKIASLLASPDPNSRVAALEAIGTMAEGARDQMLPVLGDLTQSVVRLLLDAHPRVRHSACFAVAELSTHLGDTACEGSGHDGFQVC